jgi:hypothetical protein
VTELTTRHQLGKLESQLTEITTRTAINAVESQKKVSLKTKKKLKVRQDVAVEIKAQTRKVHKQTIKLKKN